MMDIIRIKELLPHRYPFLLVDRIVECTSEGIVGIKNVSGNEAFFEGHFPNDPIMPGVLILEAMAQTGADSCSHSIHPPYQEQAFLFFRAR